MNPVTVRASRAIKHSVFVKRSGNPTAGNFATRKLQKRDGGADNPLLLRWERIAKEIRA